MTSSTTPETKVTTAQPAPGSTKPIKLRSACNSCFSAKVRCDGDKLGCRRCSEKRLDCHYSESRVGKVVGKRRKRPLPPTIGTVNTEPWNVNLPENSVPSPSNSSNSDTFPRKFSVASAWDPIVPFDDHAMFGFSDNENQFDAFNMHRSFSMVGEPPLFVNNGLPTPGMSPPDMCFLSPTAFETQPPSRTSSTIPDAKIFPPKYSSPACTILEPNGEDEETVCIKLLAHLKKNAAIERDTFDAQINLIKKTNAAIKRLLRAKAVYNDYACQLLLSSIAVHLVSMCEKVCQQRPPQARPMETDFLHDQFAMDTSLDCFGASIPGHSSTEINDAAKAVVHETAVLSSAIGDLLKRKPFNGFQTLGRHESLHVELDQRLKRALQIMQ